MKNFIVDKQTEGKKLFNYIKTVLPGIKNSEIFKLIRKKIVAVNDKKESPDYILKENDIIIIYLKEDHFKIKGKKNKFQSVNKHLDVVFENNDILVINKPKGVLSQPDKNDYKNNIYEYVRSYLYNKGEYKTDDIFTPALCNRLDRNTSGIIVAAKNHNSLKDITRQFRERETDKKYITLVYGKIDNEILLVSKINDKKEIVEITDFKFYAEIPEKKEFFNNQQMSATLIKPVYFKDNISLIHVELWTGKKHQIRAHMKAYNHPLLGDYKYFTGASKKLSDSYKFEGYFLHSYKIKIPGYNEFKAEIPEYFKSVIFKIFNKNNLDL